MNIMNFDEMESEEFPMIPEIIAREQQKDSQLKELIKRSDKFSERTIYRSKVITYENKRYILQSLLIPQVRLEHKYPIFPWEMIHPPGGDNPVRI
jgi:hypothetical protein